MHVHVQNAFGRKTKQNKDTERLGGTSSISQLCLRLTDGSFFLVKDVKEQTKVSKNAKFRCSALVNTCAGNQLCALVARAGSRVIN